MPEVGPHPYSKPSDFKYPMCSGMLYKESEVKSVALSREEAVTSVSENGEDDEEFTALAGSANGAAVSIVKGLVEAKRMPGPFRIRLFVWEEGIFVFVRKIDTPDFEMRELDLRRAFGLEENCDYQPLPARNLVFEDLLVWQIMHLYAADQSQWLGKTIGCFC